MAVFLRKPGTSKPVKVAPVQEFISPFRESYHRPEELAAFNKYEAEQEALTKVQVTATPVPRAPAPRASIKPLPPGKKIIKLTGGKPVSAASVPSLTSGVSALTRLEDNYAESKALYPEVCVGDIVKVTNSMFPWVLHYKPGDKAKVERITPHLNSATDDPIKYRVHMLRIIDGPRKGNELMLFRHEFAPFDAASAPLPAKGQLNLMK